MSDQPNNNMPPGSPDLVADLIRAAGRRETPPQEIYQRVRADAMASFEASLRRKRHSRRWIGAVAAALVGVVAAALFFNFGGSADPARAAQLLRLSGEVEAMRPDRQTVWRGVAADSAQSLPQGSRLRTGSNALVALQLDAEVTLRLDANSEVTLVNPQHIALHAGRVYIDTGDESSAQIAVTTPAGVARDIGTRFEVQYLASQLRLRIRDGRVELSRDDERISAGRGEQLAVDTEGLVERSTLAPDAAEWQWIEYIAFAPDIDGRPVRVLLDWVARETGKSLKFSDAGVETEVATTLLHGDVSLLRPLQALSVMLATTDFGFAVGDNGEIEVWSKSRQ